MKLAKAPDQMTADEFEALWNLIDYVNEKINVEVGSEAENNLVTVSSFIDRNSLV